MRSFARGLIFIILVYLGLITVVHRALYSSSFDASYWRDKFEHSQWAMPLSIRALGDDGLYLWAGYRLANGKDPSTINAEAPPLGKYLIGLSISIFGNGYIYGLVSTTLVLVLSYLIANTLLKNSVFALATIALLATDPLITAQFPLTMLDSIQTVFFLLSLLFLLKTQGKYHHIYVCLSGISLGLFAETKFPIFLPIIAFIGMFYLWQKFRSISPLAVFVVGIASGYLIPYIPYFLLGHTPLEWLKLQKWAASFYVHAKTAPTWGSAFTTMAIGISQNIYSHAWERASHWSPVWILISTFGLIETTLAFRKKNIQGILLGLSASCLFLMYQCIPFWTRYLVLIVPLFYILSALFVVRLPKKTQVLLFFLCLISNIAFSLPVLFPTPEATARQITYNIENMFFQDVYEDIVSDGRTRYSREEFNRFATMSLRDAEIESIDAEILPTTWSHFSAHQTLTIQTTFFTRHLGQFSEIHTLPLVKEKGRWKILWQWDYLIHDLTYQRTFETRTYPAKRGRILASDKKTLAEDIDSVMIWVTPIQVDRQRETAMLEYFSSLFDNHVLPAQFHQRINGNALATLPIAIGTPPHPLTDQQKTTLVSFPGVTLAPSVSRVSYGSDIVTIGSVANTHYFECCTRLYSATTYDGTNGVEFNKNALLKGADGGSLMLLNADGTLVRTLLEKEKKDGKDVEP